MRQCSIGLCSKKLYAKEMCQMHYKRVRNHGSTEKFIQLKENNPNYRHGMTGTRIHRVWAAMRSRCRDDMGRTSQYYRDNSIRVCDRWNDFNNFLEDMGETYKDGLTLDRIDNSLGYSKENCRWATMMEQSRNKRNNIFIEYNGKRMVLKDLALEIGMNYQTLHQRVHRYGMSIEEAISKPIKRRSLI